jgi:ArsR family transcriptional regulator
VVVLELMPHRESWVEERLGHKHLGFDPSQLEDQLRRAGFEGINREVHPQNAGSHFRVFLLTGEKR